MHVFDMAIPAWNIAVRTVMVFVAVFVGLRLMGKREMGQMTVFDLVVIILIANAVQNAMVGPDTSLVGGLLAAGVLLVVDWGISSLRLRGARWGWLLQGTPTVLVEDGEFIQTHLRREALDREDVEMAVREHGVESVASVKLAVLETDGSISIVPYSSPVVRTRKHIRQLRRR
jgi:uncharacterized membrane protein YcaP (DUF421 family)